MYALYHGRALHVFRYYCYSHQMCAENYAMSLYAGFWVSIFLAVHMDVKMAYWQ